MGQREKVITSIKSISDLIEEYPFCVPSYQRPYVWGNEQIYKLLNDIYAAFERNKSEAYFIGTVILYKRTRSAMRQPFMNCWTDSSVSPLFG